MAIIYKGDVMNLTKDNYFSNEANRHYMSVSQFKQFLECPACGLAQVRGEWERPATTALLEGSYIDAYFAGTLCEFTATHPEILNKRTGSLKAEFKKAQAAIELVEQDPVFMKYLAGDPQNIITGELYSVKWKAKPDFTFEDKIVDLKYMRDIKPIFKDGERKTFIDAWGYHIQGHIYQKLEQIRTGKVKPFYLAVITKEDPAGHYVIELPQWLLNSAGSIVAHYAQIFDAVKRGEIEADRCGECGYCRQTMRVNAPMQYEELVETL